MGWLSSVWSGKGQNNTSDTASSPFSAPKSAAETESFHRMMSGEERNVGGETAGGIAFSPLDRLTDQNALYQHGDARALHMDVESIEALQARFPNEFHRADEAVRGKSNTSRLFYDYENDRRFQQWKQDQEAVRARLHVHWADDWIDHPLEALVYYGRLFTTAGLFYGLGRTAYLYRTMDKAYARLHGISLATIAVSEVSTAVCKGAATAAGGVAGLLAGDTTANLFSVIRSGDVSMPERHWSHVWTAGIGSGIGAGGVFAGLHYQTLTVWGMGAVVGGFTTVFAATSFYVAYALYRPFAAERTHRLYDPYWRPWSERLVGYGGPHHVRGRYT